MQLLFKRHWLKPTISACQLIEFRDLMRQPNGADDVYHLRLLRACRYALF